MKVVLTILTFTSWKRLLLIISEILRERNLSKQFKPGSSLQNLLEESLHMNGVTFKIQPIKTRRRSQNCDDLFHIVFCLYLYIYI